MPFTPESIQRRIDESDEQGIMPKLGEEGVLSKIDLNGESYYAKRWRGKHYKNPHGKPGSNHEQKDWKTAVSPFWHKLKFYEAALIHEAVPEATLPIHAGFDPRTDKKGEAFEFTHGRPVTVMLNVPGNPDLRRKRDRLVDDLYQYNLETEIRNSEGRWTGRKDNYEHLLRWGQHDADFPRQFGEFLGVRRIIPTDLNTPLRRENFVKRVQTDYPDTVVEELVEAGIIPVHAEVNYIPTEWIGEKTTKGIFIETAIFDHERLKNTLIQKRALKPEYNDVPEGKIAYEVKQKMDRLHLLDKLDECWDEVYYDHPQSPRGWSLQWNSEFATEVFARLMRVFRTPELHPFFLKEELPGAIKFALNHIHYSKNLEDGLERIKFLDTTLNKLQALARKNTANGEEE